MTDKAQIIWLLLSTKSCALILTRNLLDYILGDFFKNASGHPANGSIFFITTSKTDCAGPSSVTRLGAFSPMY
jgi:hypothetical protein